MLFVGRIKKDGIHQPDSTRPKPPWNRTPGKSYGENASNQRKHPSITGSQGVRWEHTRLKDSGKTAGEVEILDSAGDMSRMFHSYQVLHIADFTRTDAPGKSTY